MLKDKNEPLKKLRSLKLFTMVLEADPKGKF
jgi:hypothetical protein